MKTLLIFQVSLQFRLAVQFVPIPKLDAQINFSTNNINYLINSREYDFHDIEGTWLSMSWFDITSQVAKNEKSTTLTENLYKIGKLMPKGTLSNFHLPHTTHKINVLTKIYFLTACCFSHLYNLVYTFFSRLSSSSSLSTTDCMYTYISGICFSFFCCCCSVPFSVCFLSAELLLTKLFFAYISDYSLLACFCKHRLDF